MLNKKIILLSSFLPLLGCGGGSNKEVSIENLKEVPSLNEMSMALTPLKSVNATAFEQHLKNGVYLSSIQQDGILENTASDTGTPVPATTDSSNQQQGYSTTITQEKGVDEGDRIKYDGEFM